MFGRVGRDVNSWAPAVVAWLVWVLFSWDGMGWEKHCIGVSSGMARLESLTLLASFGASGFGFFGAMNGWMDG